MAFIDQAKFHVQAGDGGNGCISFRREKYVPRGGPNGGDGGRGGSVYFRVDNNTDTLSGFRGRNHIKAEHGRPGEGRKCYGRKGQDMTIIVPPGTTVVDMETGEELFDLLEEGEVVQFLEGGKGGLGNMHFKNASNQRPTYAQPGLPGITKEVRLEMKLIADVGLVGYPNSGKSTLLSRISHARPKIADYPFTTLIPNLGVCEQDGIDFVIADIPGIIEGAAEGKGLGHRFLRHIERNSSLLFLIPADSDNIQKEYNILLNELKKHNPELLDKERLLAISKSDMLDDELKEEIEKELPKDLPYLFISSVAQTGLTELKDKLWAMLNG